MRAGRGPYSRPRRALPAIRDASSVRTEGHFNPGNPAAVAIIIRAAAEGWGIRVPAATAWTRAASYLVKGDRARWALEYDPRLRLISFEVWERERCVYGSDDVVA